MTAAAEKHTPTPWYSTHVMECDLAGAYPPRPLWHIYKKSGEFGHPATAYSEADAAVIVRAVNAHDDMLKALKYASDELGKQAATSSGVDALKQVDAAIAKASSPAA